MSEVERAVEGLTRRKFLRRGFYGVAAVTLGSVAVALQPSRSRPLPAAGLEFLSERQSAVVSAVAGRVQPAAPGILSGSQMGVAEKLDARMASATQAAQRGVSTLLDVFENGLTGMLFAERVRPFTALSGAEQDAVLRSWRDSRLSFRRAGYRALTSICSGLYYSDPRSWAQTGYPGPPSPQALRLGYAENLVNFDSLRASDASD